MDGEGFAGAQPPRRREIASECRTLVQEGWGRARERVMSYVRAMCAIGKRGQLGLNGMLPWEGAKGHEYIADVQRFWDMTRGHVILTGPRTKSSVPEFAYAERTIVEIRSSLAPEAAIATYPGRMIFVGGGPPVFAAYARFVQHWDITRLPYDGEADRWFDPLWLTAVQ